MVALELVLNTPVVTVKVADVAAAATVTEAGIVNAALVFDKVIAALPLGAGWVSVTVHVVDELAPRLLALQERVETSTGATRLTMVLAEVLL